MRVRRLIADLLGISLVALGCADLIVARWRGGIFSLALGTWVAIAAGGIGDKVLPANLRTVLRPETRRGALRLTVVYAYLGIAGALVFVLVDDPVPAGLILVFASLILALALREMGRPDT